MHASSMTGYSSRLLQISSSWHFCLEHDIYHLSSRMCFFLEGMFWQVWGTHFHGWHAAPYVKFWLVGSQPEGLDPNLRTRCGKHVGKEKGGGHWPRAGEASPSASVLPGFGSTEASPFRPQGNICTNKGDLRQHHGKTVWLLIWTHFQTSSSNLRPRCWNHVFVVLRLPQWRIALSHICKQHGHEFHWAVAQGQLFWKLLIQSPMQVPSPERIAHNQLQSKFFKISWMHHPGNWNCGNKACSRIVCVDLFFVLRAFCVVQTRSTPQWRTYFRPCANCIPWIALHA